MWERLFIVVVCLFCQDRGDLGTREKEDPKLGRRQGKERQIEKENP